MEEPLSSVDAIRLLRVLKSGGIEVLVFAGGDPTLRADLAELVLVARKLGITPVIHTNGHAVHASSWDAFRMSDHIGLSLDSVDPEVHDTMRGRRGNHGKVLRILERCCEESIRVSLRTVISAMNLGTIHLIGPVIARYPCVQKWRLLEFTPVELGWYNKARHLVSPDVVDAVFHRAAMEYSGSATVDLLRNKDKIDAYFMVAANGFAYGVTESDSIATGRHRYVGSLLTEHIGDIAGRIAIEPARHALHLP